MTASFLALNRDVREEIRARGYCYVPAHDFTLSTWASSEWEELAETWNDLRIDKYMPDGATYRQRRYGRFFFVPGIEKPIRLSHAPFVQAKEMNPYAGDLERWFEPFHEKTFENEFLLRLIGFNFSQLPIDDDMIDGPWEIKVQQIRIRARASIPGNPTPEGMHRDGFEFFTLHLVRRKNVRGGVITICDNEGNTLAEFTFEQPLDTVFIDDRRVLHGASLVELAGDADEGVRDILIINYVYQPGLLLDDPTGITKT